MKKLLSILLAIVFAATLTSPAFAADADAYSIYQKSIKKLKSVSSVDLPISAKFSITDGKQSVDVTELNMGFKILTTADKKRQMEWKMVYPETGEIYNVYYKDGFFYENSNNKKSKYKRDLDIEEIMDGFLETFNLNLTKNDFKNAQVKKVDGDTKITLKKAFPFDDDWSNSTLSITIGSDDMLKSCSFSYTEPVDKNSDKLKLKATLTIRVKSVNSLKKINFPSDLNTYKGA